MIYKLNADNKNFIKDLIKKINKRSVFSDKDYNIAKKIVLDVKKNGDKAILKYEKKFNKNRKLKTNHKEIVKNIKNLSPKVKKSLDFAFNLYVIFNFL